MTLKIMTEDAYEKYQDLKVKEADLIKLIERGKRLYSNVYSKSVKSSKIKQKKR